MILDLDVIPCRHALDGDPDHGAHERNVATVCPGTYLHETDLPDRAAAYDSIGRIANLAGVDWSTMANSVAAIAATRPTYADGGPGPTVCLSPATCSREHVGGAGGTPCHLPSDGLAVPGHFDHGVPAGSRS